MGSQNEPFLYPRNIILKKKKKYDSCYVFFNAIVPLLYLSFNRIIQYFNLRNANLDKKLFLFKSIQFHSNNTRRAYKQRSLTFIEENVSSCRITLLSFYSFYFTFGKSDKVHKFCFSSFISFVLKNHRWRWERFMMEGRHKALDKKETL